MNRFRVFLRSTPGFMAQYSGYVDVWADDETDAIDLALIKLKRGSFPERSRSCWRVDKVERLWGHG